MTKAAMTRFLKEYPTALADGVGAVFVGAGMSMAAGYPSWVSLLREIGDELGVSSRDIQDLAALAQWSIQESGSATRVRNVIKEQIGKDHDVPATLEVIARLPVHHIWTTNYDRLVERAFAAIDRPLDALSGAADLSLKPTPGAARLYKMHGSIDRLDDIVISTDDYELFRSRRGAFLPLLQAHLTNKSILFVGLSFTDPNIRHVLSLIRESFTDAPPEHFAIVRPPHPDDFDTEDEYKARLAQHKLWAKDLRRYGLVAVEIDSYDEVPGLLRQIERRVAARRVWVSGSWPLEDGDGAAARYSLAEDIGRWIGHTARDLVSGAGLLVGSGTIAGFLEALRDRGGWDLSRRLIARPFPQPLAGRAADQAKWTMLRHELARQAGAVIFIGGAKIDGGDLVVARGVMEEFEIAREAGVFLLPIGASGGAAAEIAAAILGSKLPAIGPEAVRPTDAELQLLIDESVERKAVLECVAAILERVGKAA
ncbi:MULTISPECIES: SIR2 family protein [unclassified Sphingomonas]|uniref:SIR2 family protein n=1 Tax=unclassified Sphingomonas TaxID=196159 RepID=UPI00082C86D5|nr:MULTISPECIES: SIR2 family protein [unclassified Sphingomonas]